MGSVRSRKARGNSPWRLSSLSLPGGSGKLEHDRAVITPAIRDNLDDPARPEHSERGGVRVEHRGARREPRTVLRPQAVDRLGQHRLAVTSPAPLRCHRDVDLRSFGPHVESHLPDRRVTVAENPDSRGCGREPSIEPREVIGPRDRHPAEGVAPSLEIVGPAPQKPGIPSPRPPPPDPHAEPPPRGPE